jgi:hypothetical protein
MLDQNASDAEIKKIIDAKYAFKDELGVLQHHDAIAGTETQTVAIDYQWRLHKRQEESLGPYKKWIQNQIADQAGVKVEKDILTCVGTQNDTVLDCPVQFQQDKKEFIVVIHNPRSSNDLNDLARIILPSAGYKAQLWNPSTKAFEDAITDIIE